MYGEQAERDIEITGGERPKDPKLMKEVVDRSRKNQQMYLAAESGTVEDVCSIEGKLKVPITDSISSNGNTALHVAAAKREGGFLKSILRDEIQLIDVRNLEGST
ncbi:hypothetical protein Hanom_Chr05g00451491 [Helianthus anomalus]